MNRSGVLLLILLSASPGAAQSLEIVGETKVPAYRLVRLSSSLPPSPDAATIWDVSPDERADVEELPGRLIFTAAPGTYTIKLRVIRFADGKVTIQAARTTVTIEGAPLPPPGPVPVPPVPPGPGPLPPPTPPVPPTPQPDRLGFTALSRDEGAKVVSSARKHAAHLAGNYESTAAKLAAGSIDVAGSKAELRASNNAALGEDRQFWLAWFVAWGNRADSLLANGTMRNTKDDWVAAYMETAAGLKQVK